MENGGAAVDPELLLKQWLGETDAERSGHQLELLLARHAQPLIRRIVAFKLGSAGDSGARLPPADVEDVCQNALCQLLSRLERMKQGDSSATLRDFTAYTAVTAYNACNAYFRSKRPAWLSLSMKIRYAATHSAKFALWESADGAEVCGLASQRNRAPLADAAALIRACEGVRARIDASRLPTHELMDQLFKAVAHPLVFESLVDAAADVSGIRDERPASLEPDHEGASETHGSLPDTRPPADVQLVNRAYIRLLWEQIRALPVEHRRALLLNLNDAAGGDIRLFDSLGIASVRQIAAAVEMEPLEFARLWNDLPLDDTRLAQMLGITRQDVINRRSTARKRLARAMSQHEL